MSKLSDLNPSKSALIGFDTMAIRNISGFNKDHLGSNHCKVFLEFYDIVTINGPIYFDQFIDICYRIKSHKFDNMHETYLGTKINKSGSNDIKVNVCFNSGS